MRAGIDVVKARGAAYGVHVTSRRGNRVLHANIPAYDVRIEQTLDRVVPSRVTFKVTGGQWVPVDALDPLNNYGQRVLIEAIVEAPQRVDRIPLGWFVITEWEETEYGVEVTALDLTHHLAENPMSWPSSPPQGATLRSELQRLAGSLPVELDNLPDVAIARTFQWGTDRLESIRDLCESRGLMYGVKADGVLHVWKPAGVTHVDAAYSGDDLMIDAPRKSTPRRANRVIVAGEGEIETTVTESRKTSRGKITATRKTVRRPVKHAAVRTNTAGAYSPNDYGWVTDRRELSSTPQKTAVEQAADAAMREVMAAASIRSVEIMYDPRLELGDVITVRTPAGETLAGRVHALSATVDDPGAAMRVDVKELAW